MGVVGGQAASKIISVGTDAGAASSWPQFFSTIAAGLKGIDGGQPPVQLGGDLARFFHLLAQLRCELVEGQSSLLCSFGQRAPGRQDTALRDAIQRLALAHRHYGYRRITALLKREGWVVNHKRVARLMREDNLLCLRKATFKPSTTDCRHDWRVWPNLARRLVPMAINQLWVADITYVRLEQASSIWRCCSTPSAAR